MELERYRCKKVVRAGKIVDVRPMKETDLVELVIEGLGYTIPVSKDWCKEQAPFSGGYYMEQEDGHTSYCTEEQFEKDYTKV